MTRTRAGITGALALAAPQAGGEAVDGKMFDQGRDGQGRDGQGRDGADMVFEPTAVTIDPGETVRFKAVGTSHNAQAIEAMIPKAEEPFRGGISEDFKVTFEVEGTDVDTCLPHFSSGMVGVVRGGDALKTIDAVRDGLSTRPKRARDRVAPLPPAGGS